MGRPRNVLGIFHEHPLDVLGILCNVSWMSLGLLCANTDMTRFYLGTYYFHRHMEPAPPVVIKISLFCGRCFTDQTVESWAFSVRYAKPFFGCWVRRSKQCILDSKVVATTLFIGMFFRSNCSPTTYTKKLNFLKKNKIQKSDLVLSSLFYRKSICLVAEIIFASLQF